tara:strand:- start:29 stop:304 length:276 start_codon:yes stop_codon:yes gene_type:complete
MDNNLEFPEGIIFKLPRNEAPDFVKGSISIKRADLIKWLNSKSDEWINLDLKVGKSGKAYAAINTWKPETTSSNLPTPSAVTSSSNNDLPF